MTAESRVLVTGGTGFIGTYVARELLDSGRQTCLYDVNPLSSEARHVLGDRIDALAFEQGSIEDVPRLLDVVKRHRPRSIIHLATITDPRSKNPLPSLRVNFEGTLNVLDAVRLFEVERLINFSSIGVLPSPQYEPIDAAHPIILPTEAVPTVFYGASKVAGEAFCFAYREAFGVDFRTIRPSAVYGLGMRWPIFIKPMVEGAVRGDVQEFSSGGPLARDYTHVADVASLTVALLNAPDDADRVFYAATGEPLVTAAEVAKVVMELVPGSRIEIADTLSETDEATLRFRGRLSIENARTQVGWEPRFRKIRDGIADYIEQYRRYLEVAS